MSNNFDLRKFLTENQLTTTAKAVSEAPNIPIPGNKPKMPPVPGQGSSNQAPKNTGMSDKAKNAAKEALFQVIASTSTLKNAGVLDANEVKQLEDLCNKAMGNLNEGETPINEMNGGYLEVMGDEFHKAAQEIAKAWTRWRNGPATEPEDIEPAKEDVLEFLKSMIR